MARFSPRDPGFTRVPTLGDAIASLATSAGAGQEAARRREIEDEALDFDRESREQGRENRELELFERGFTRDPRREEVPEEEDGFAGAGIGLAGEEQPRPADVFEGAGIGLQPDQAPAAGALDQIAQQGVQPEPQVLAIPGAFVEGMGFAPRTITDMDLVQERQRMARRPRSRLGAGVQQVTDDLFFDERLSPEGRRAEREEEETTQRRARLESVLAAIAESGGEVPPEVVAEGMELGLSDRQLRGETGPEEDTIRVQGRDFPNTPAGERAAIAWREALAEAGRSGGSGSGAAERITGEVTRRTLATAAARALDSIRQDVRELSNFERSRLEPGQIQRQIQETLELFGFENPQELEAEMRELRLAGTGELDAGGADAGGGGLTDEQIDELILANPGLSPEELLELIERGG